MKKLGRVLLMFVLVLTMFFQDMPVSALSFGTRKEETAGETPSPSETPVVTQQVTTDPQAQNSADQSTETNTDLQTDTTDAPVTDITEQAQQPEQPAEDQTQTEAPVQEPVTDSNPTPATDEVQQNNTDSAETDADNGLQAAGKMNLNGLSASNTAAETTYIKSVTFDVKADGTAPFDTTEPEKDGNDGAANNGRIRSYDQMEYNIVTSYQTVGNDSADGKNIFYEITMPDYGDELQLDYGATGLTKEQVEITPDEATHTKKYKFSFPIKTQAKGATGPGESQRPVFFDVLGMKKGDTIQPSVRCWIENNENNNYPDTVTDTPDNDAQAPVTTVTSAPAYNVILKSGGAANMNYYKFDGTNNKNFFDNTTVYQPTGYTTDTVKGFAVTWGVAVELRNADTSKGLRGIEIPDKTKPLSFDVDISDVTYKPSDNSTSHNTFNEGWKPLLYSVRQNKDSWNDHISVKDIPGSNQSDGSDKSKFCLNSGTYTVAQSEDKSKLTFSVTGYDIDSSKFPKYSLGNTETYYTDLKKILEGVFTSAQFTVVYPIEKTDGTDIQTEDGVNGNFIFKAKADNLSATSIHNTTVNTETVPYSDQPNVYTDNTAEVTKNQIGGHGRTHEVYFSSNVDSYSSWTKGSDNDASGSVHNKGNDSDSATLGSMVYFTTTWNEENTSIALPTAGRTVAADQLILIQGDAIDITNGSYKHTYNGYALDVMYATYKKPLDFEETKTLKMESSDLHYYSDLNQAKNSGEHVVGLLLRWRGISYYINQGVDINQSQALSINQTEAKIKENSKADTVYSITIQTKLYDTDVFNGDSRVSITPEMSENEKADVYRNAAKQYLLPEAGPLAKAYPNMATASNGNGSMDQRTAYENQPTYNSTGYHAGGSDQAGYYFSRGRADSLYVVPYYTQITKTVAQKDQNNGQKKTFNQDKGETFVDYKLSGSLNFAQSGMSFADGNKTTTITITDTIPEGLTYVEGSAIWDPASYEEVAGKPGKLTGGTKVTPSIKKDSDNSEVLTWTIKGVKVQDGELPLLYYSCFINNKATNNKELKNTVTIQSSEEHRVICSANKNISDAAVQISKSSAFNISKFGDHDLELNDDATFTLVASNSLDTDRNNFIMVDSMPYNGIDAGAGKTVMNGKYSITNMTVNKNSELINDTSDIHIYYTNSEKYKGANDVTNVQSDELSNRNIWTEATRSDNGDEDPSWNVTGWPTAIAIKDDKLAAHNSIFATIHYKAKAAENDHLYNFLMAKGAGSTITSNADVVIYSRDLSGTVWIDDNFNGLMDDGEERVPGVKVQLQHKNDNGDWVTVNTYTGTDGKEHKASTVTDANGFYKFDKLRKGTDYRVVFTSGNTPESDLSQYYMTNQNAGDDKTKTSKTNPVNGKVSEGDITGISMPTIEEMKAQNTSQYSLPDQNMGLYRVRRTISGTAWFDANGDGIYQKDATDDTKEYPMKGVEVSLYRKDKDGNYVPYKVSGKEVTTTTDDNGQYVFEKLPEGEYEVIFGDGKGHNAKISAFNVTLPDQGTDPGTRSIADAGKDGTAVVSRQNGSTDGIRLLSDQELIAGKTSLQTIDNLNAGFVPNPVDITVTKVWNDNSNQDGLRPDPETFGTALKLERFKADQNGKATGDAEIIDTVPVVSDNQNNTYTVAYNNLLSVSYDGNEFTHYVYKVREDSINGYRADTPEAGNGEAIINTHKPDVPVNPPVNPEETGTPVQPTPSVTLAPSDKPETGKVPGEKGGKPSVSPSPKPKTEVKKSEAPDTGDHSNNGLYAGLLGLCVVFIVWRMLGLRKEHRND